MIHVHHLKMISKTNKEYIVNLFHGFRPSCPNCHMVIYKKEGYTIEDVKVLMSTAVEFCKIYRGSQSSVLTKTREQPRD